MFTQNRYVPALEEHQTGQDYFLLYYQFIKHSFGLQFAVPEDDTASAAVCSMMFREMRSSSTSFKEYLSGLSTFPKWSRAGFSILYEDITDVDSKKHNILQAPRCCLGRHAVSLEREANQPVPPAKRRSKRARAKAKVYDAIKARIFDLYPNFNVGVSTAATNGLHMRFEHPYRHWLFVPIAPDWRTIGRKKPQPKRSDPTRTYIGPRAEREGSVLAGSYQISGLNRKAIARAYRHRLFLHG